MECLGSFFFPKVELPLFPLSYFTKRIQPVRNFEIMLDLVQRVGLTHWLWLDSMLSLCTLCWYSSSWNLISWFESERVAAPMKTLNNKFKLASWFLNWMQCRCPLYCRSMKLPKLLLSSTARHQFDIYFMV